MGETRKMRGKEGRRAAPVLVFFRQKKGREKASGGLRKGKGVGELGGGLP